MLPISKSFRCFDEVAQRGSVRKAADFLHLTPAAVHQQVVNLEAQVGIPLFDRVPRGMQLTAAGEVLLAAVRRSQRDVDAALLQVEAMRSLRRGSVAIGVSESSAEAIVARVIEAASATYPGIGYRVRTGHGEAILKWIANGDVDLGYCLRRNPPPGVEEVKAWPQRLGAVTAPDHPLARQTTPLALRACLGFPLVLATPEMELRSLFDRICRREKQEPRPFVETSSMALLRRLVDRGTVVGFAIAENVADDVGAGRLVWLPLRDAEARTSTCAYQRGAQKTAVAMGVFLQFLDAAVGELVRRFDGIESTRTHGV